MNRTDTLLRLKRFRVDEMKRRIASIAAMKADLERKLTDLDDNPLTIHAAQDVATDDLPGVGNPNGNIDPVNAFSGWYCLSVHNLVLAERLAAEIGA